MHHALHDLVTLPKEAVTALSQRQFFMRVAAVSVSLLRYLVVVLGLLLPLVVMEYYC